MKVAFVGGYWATNIGNAFFNMGAEYVLKEVFGKENVHMIFDQPSGIFRGEKKKGNPKRALDLITSLDVEMIVLLGPVISKYFLSTWKSTLDNLKQRGVRYSIFSCGIMKCTPDDLLKIGAYFKENPPAAITTRDQDAYNNLLPYVDNIYDGIDFAFYVPKIHNPISLIDKNIITLNFDKYFEPKIKVFCSDDNNYDFDFDGKRWKLKFNNLFKSIGKTTDRFTDALIYIFSVFPAKDRAVKIDQYRIYRTDHRFTPILKNKVFRYSNSFVSDIPHSYLDIYAASKLTLSDRVHACAVTLAYGNHAMFFSKTNRSKLLDRVGARDINVRPVKIDLDKLSEERIMLINWLRTRFLQ